MKKLAHLLDERQIPWDRNDPLQSRVGKYVKALNQEREIRESRAASSRAQSAFSSSSMTCATTALSRMTMT
jgi:hypothetical protein